MSRRENVLIAGPTDRLDAEERINSRQKDRDLLVGVVWGHFTRGLRTLLIPRQWTWSRLITLVQHFRPSCGPCQLDSLCRPATSGLGAAHVDRIRRFVTFHDKLVPGPVCGGFVLTAVYERNIYSRLSHAGLTAHGGRNLFKFSSNFNRLHIVKSPDKSLFKALLSRKQQKLRAHLHIKLRQTRPFNLKYLA